MDATGPLPPAESRPRFDGAQTVHRPAFHGAEPFRLRRMGLQDLAVVADMHRAEFREGFFVRLGAHFLRRYYRTFLDGPLAAALVCEKEGTVWGYLVGVLDPLQHRRLLIRHHGPALAASALISLIWRPALALHFVRTRARRYLRAFLRKPPAAATETEKLAVLTYLVVDPSVRGYGVGSALVERFLREAAAADRTAVCLVTVAGAGGAGGFYAPQGWVRVGESRRSDGQPLEHYRLQLDQGA